MNTDKTPYEAGRFHRIVITRDSKPNIKQTQRAMRFLSHLPEMLKQLSATDLPNIIREATEIRDEIESQ